MVTHLFKLFPGTHAMRMLIGFAVFVALAMGPAPAQRLHAQTRNRATEEADAARLEATQRAEVLAREGLMWATLGDSVKCRDCMAEALQHDENQTLARWTLGQIQVDGHWVDSMDHIRKLVNDVQLGVYRNRRALSEDTVADHLQLAQWCNDQGLHPQSRAHLFRVLSLEPDHEPVRTALGHRRINDRWVTPEEIEDATKRMAEDIGAFESYRGSLAALLPRLIHEREAVRMKAREDLLSIDDPKLTTALEIMLAGHSEPLALLYVEVVSRWHELKATESLARQSIISPWPSVREAAAKSLVGRPLIDFVPGLLAEFVMPVSRGVMAVQVAPNRLVYREVLMTEDKSDIQVSFQDTIVDRVSMPGGNKRETVQRIMRDMIMYSQLADAQHRQTNAGINERNQVITDSLRISTEKNFENDPRTWWNWWNELNGVSQSAKDVVQRYNVSMRQYCDQMPRFTGGGSQGLGESSDPDPAPPTPTQPKPEPKPTPVGIGTTGFGSGGVGTSGFSHNGIGRSEFNYSRIGRPIVGYNFIGRIVSGYNFVGRQVIGANGVGQPGFTQRTRNGGPSNPGQPSPTPVPYPQQPYSPVSLPIPMRGECFAAGTMVTTDRGLIPIEAVQVGDQVLCKEVESGELGLKPVLESTRRAPVVLYDVLVEGETLHVTGQHPFWVAGSGWVLAQDLHAGMLLHTLRGEVQVLGLTLGEIEPTYNLIVDRCGTYLVGENQILVHDWNLRKPTRSLMPGLNP